MTVEIDLLGGFRVRVNSRFVALESRNHILLADEPAWPAFVTEVEEFLSPD